ncbi:MAG: hypothetical protein WBG92_20145, partial [Thiohalocapsa sp.]
PELCRVLNRRQLRRALWPSRRRPKRRVVGLHFLADEPVVWSAVPSRRCPRPVFGGRNAGILLGAEEQAANEVEVADHR